MRALALASPMVNSSLTTCLITTEPINVNFDPCWGSARRPDHISLVQYGTKLEKNFKTLIYTHDENIVCYYIIPNKLQRIVVF